VREALGSRRWSGETKTLVVMTLGPALAWLSIGLELWWVLTGRGRRLRHVLAEDVVVAIPTWKRMPSVFAEQLAEIRAAPTVDKMRSHATPLAVGATCMAPCMA
jgi:hypothetical protein